MTDSAPDTAAHSPSHTTMLDAALNMVVCQDCDHKQPATVARRLCEKGQHNFGPPSRNFAPGVEPMSCQCQRLMLGYYRDNGEPFVYVVTPVEAAP